MANKRLKADLVAIAVAITVFTLGASLGTFLAWYFL